MVKALAHICLLSSDLQRTLEFYTETLGMKKKFDFLRDGQWIGFYIEIGDRQYIEVFENHDDLQASGVRKGIPHFCLEVEDIQTMHDVLVARDVAVTAPKFGADQSWQIWCKDPDGIDIEFHQYTDASSQLTGKNCLVNW